jgi:hypothetical protein
MVCRSCSLGPVKPKKNYNQTKIEKVAAKTHPSKGIITSNKKVSVPTKSPTRTFNTLGE